MPSHHDDSADLRITAALSKALYEMNGTGPDDTPDAATPKRAS